MVWSGLRKADTTKWMAGRQCIPSCPEGFQMFKKGALPRCRCWLMLTTRFGWLSWRLCWVRVSLFRTSPPSSPSSILVPTKKSQSTSIDLTMAKLAEQKSTYSFISNSYLITVLENHVWGKYWLDQVDLVVEEYNAPQASEEAMRSWRNDWPKVSRYVQLTTRTTE